MVSISVLAQERNYYSEAEQAFNTSEYIKAEKLYLAAYVITGIDTHNKQKLCDQCAEAQKNAREQKVIGNNSEAESYYRKLLEYNPNDLEAKSFCSNNSNKISMKKQNDSLIISGDNNFINGHEYVDLGLPSGLKWATCNVGASLPTDYGYYFAWGEIHPKSDYSESNCKTCNKFFGEIKGNTEFDTARANWGGSWRMPTKDEFEELGNNCTWSSEKIGNSIVYILTGPNGKSIFLPAAGSNKLQIEVPEDCGFYWSSTPFEDSYSAYRLCLFDFSAGKVDIRSRGCGFSVRPVSE